MRRNYCVLSCLLSPAFGAHRALLTEREARARYAQHPLVRFCPILHVIAAFCRWRLCLGKKHCAICSRVCGLPVCPRKSTTRTAVATLSVSLHGFLGLSYELLGPLHSSICFGHGSSGIHIQ